MEFGGARHLFNVSDGLGYPAKKTTDYYHFILGSTVSIENAIVYGKNRSNFTIEMVPFPHSSIIAARTEYRVSDGRIEAHDSIDFPVAFFDQKILEDNGIISSIIASEFSRKAVIYKLDFKEVLKNLRYLKEYGSIPINFSFKECK
ncbi:hypothetical protein [Fluviispira vulneris]|uniref:hypothetical protein n=1 Tax=Fluviispira vulneris TaxID=2763012 RepID=UPI001646820C|nr:hypothetical protein [Fluviispira vulneris]